MRAKRTGPAAPTTPGAFRQTSDSLIADDGSAPSKGQPSPELDQGIEAPWPPEPPSRPGSGSHIHTRSLTPCQQTTTRDFRTAADFRIAQMLKHAPPSEFHSLAEYFHAALLEGDPTVSRFVPQPFVLNIGKEHYKPDCYVVRDHRVEVVELKPRAKFNPQKRKTLEAFFRDHHMRFSVVANESVLARRIEACNWLTIVQTLVLHRDLDTRIYEQAIHDQVFRAGGGCIGDWVLAKDRSTSRAQEIALFRLLHQGKLTADLTDHRLSFETEVLP